MFKRPRDHGKECKRVPSTHYGELTPESRAVVVTYTIPEKDYEECHYQFYEL